MAIINRITDDELVRDFTHVGWFCGLCPVYISDLDSGAPMLVERNWIPEMWLDAVESMFAAYCYLASWANPWFEPTFPILVTGVIDGPEDRRHG